MYGRRDEVDFVERFCSAHSGYTDSAELRAALDITGFRKSIASRRGRSGAFKTRRSVTCDVDLRLTQSAYARLSFMYWIIFETSRTLFEPAGILYSNSAIAGIGHWFFFSSCITGLIGVSP